MENKKIKLKKVDHHGNVIDTIEIDGKWIIDFEKNSYALTSNGVGLLGKHHELDDTLTNLKSFEKSLSEYVIPPNYFGWSLSNLPSYYWETLGECINDIEKYIQKNKVMNENIITKEKTVTREDIDKQAFLLMTNITGVKIKTNIDDKHHETLMNSFLILMGMFNEFINKKI